MDDVVVIVYLENLKNSEGVVRIIGLSCENAKHDYAIQNRLDKIVNDVAENEYITLESGWKEEIANDLKEKGINKIRIFY